MYGLKKIKLSDQSFNMFLKLYDESDSMALAYLGWDKEMGAAIEFSSSQFKKFIDIVITMATESMLNYRVVNYQSSDINSAISFLSTLMRTNLHGNAIRGCLEYLIDRLFELDYSVFSKIEWTNISGYFTHEKRNNVYKEVLAEITPKLFNRLANFKKKPDGTVDHELPVSLLLRLKITDDITPVKKEIIYISVMSTLKANFETFAESVELGKYCEVGGINGEN